MALFQGQRSDTLEHSVHLGRGAREEAENHSRNGQASRKGREKGDWNAGMDAMVMK
jgi:hypothetical protein